MATKESGKPSGPIGVTALSLLVALALITGIDRFIIRVDGTNYRVELLVGGLCLISALILLGRFAWRALGWVEYLLAGWVGVSVLSSLLFAPDPADSLKLTVLLAGLLVIFLAVVLLLRDRKSLYSFALLWVAIGSGVVFLGVVQGLLFTFFGITTGMHFNRSYVDGTFSAIPMVTGTVWEPNLFGSFALAVAAVAAGLSFAPRLSGRLAQIRMHTAVVIGYAGAVVSMTRTVWLVAALMATLIVLQPLRIGPARIDRRQMKLIGSVGLGALVGLLVAFTLPTIRWKTANPGALTLVEVAERAGKGVRGEPIEGAISGTKIETQSALEDRTGELSEVSQIPSLLIRQEVMVNSFKGWLERPLLGWGTGAYPQVFVIAPGAPNWIPNIFMHVLFDTGLVGLALFAGALGTAAWRAFSNIRKPVGEWASGDYATYGLILACFALLLTYQLTDGTWMGFTWVLLAMLSVAGNRNHIQAQKGLG